jgi:hypothetical protein
VVGNLRTPDEEMTVKTSKLVAALALVLSAGIAPAFAADEPLQQAVDSALVVTRVGGMGAGVAVGIPVATIRQTRKTYVNMTNGLSDKMGGHECGPCVLGASIFTLPAALVVGPATGAYYGMKNGVQQGWAKPFNPDSFSMAEDYSKGD